MRTRKENGFYLKMHKGLIVPSKFAKEKLNIKSKPKKIKRSEIQKEMEYLNTYILKNLISSTQCKQNKKVTIQISENLTNFLVTNYTIKKNSNTWFNGKQILTDFCMENERYFNQYDFCLIKDNSFKIRIYQKHLKYKDKRQTNKKSYFQNTITLKFTTKSLKI